MPSRETPSPEAPKTPEPPEEEVSIPSSQEVPEEKTDTPPMEEENLYELFREKRAFQRAAEHSPAAVADQAREHAHEVADRVREHLKQGRPAARERWAHDKEEAERLHGRGLLEEEVIAALGEHAEAYENARDLQEELEDLRVFEIRRSLEKKTDPYARKAHEQLLGTARTERESIASQLEETIKEDPHAARAAELAGYVKDLYTEGHIAHTPSVRTALERVGQNMRAGRPMFLHGPTGTGKTSLARLAAEYYTGKKAEMVYCSPQTRESAVWGKTGIRPTKEGAIETVDIYGPLAKAMAEGTPVIFDEFSALPQEQMVFIKGIFNAQVGDEVNVVGNGKVTIQPGFQMIFTANLKSEKNPERQALPPEVAREFEQNNIKIDYTPADEAYDIMLARLMEKDGSVRLSWHDLNNTLPAFCAAMSEIQTAYTGELPKDAARLTGTLDAAGHAPSLKKFVLTQGTVGAVLEDWRARKEEGEDVSFVEHLDERLAIGLTFEEYPEKDRILAAKILAAKGMLRTTTPAELGLPADVFNFDAANTVRNGEGKDTLIAESRDVRTVSLAELADLDPFGRRSEAAAQKARAFMPEPTVPEHGEADLSQEALVERYGDFMKETFTKWYNAEDAEVAQVPIPQDPRSEDYEARTNDTDTDKFGEYTLNPETQGLDFESWPKEKIKILDLADMQGKKLWEVAEHLVDTYSETHYIPGIEFWEWLLEEYDTAPKDVQEKYAELADGNWHHFFGSLVRSRGGYWCVPYVVRDGTGWNRNANWLVSGWFARGRVLLLEK